MLWWRNGLKRIRRVDFMEFQEFVRQYLRMHNAYFKKDCKGCPLKSVCSEFSNCTYVSIKYPREAESIVAKWAAEHPEKPMKPVESRVWTMQDFINRKIAVTFQDATELDAFLSECTKAELCWSDNRPASGFKPTKLEPRDIVLYFGNARPGYLGWDLKNIRYGAEDWVSIPAVEFDFMRKYTMSDFKAGKIAVVPGTAENVKRMLNECARLGLHFCSDVFSNGEWAISTFTRYPDSVLAFDPISNTLVWFWDAKSIGETSGYTAIPFSALTLPELVYPTWEEWQKEKFPDASSSMHPCCFGPCERFDDGSNDCGNCMERPIPADIAEKLGVKPKN
jgi:hypothetical protein